MQKKKKNGILVCIYMWLCGTELNGAYNPLIFMVIMTFKCFSHFQSQSSVSWGGRGRRWHGLWWCWCYCYNSSGAAGTGQHTAPSPPQTAALETKHTLRLIHCHKRPHFINKRYTISFKESNHQAKFRQVQLNCSIQTQFKSLVFDLISVHSPLTRVLSV